MTHFIRVLDAEDKASSLLEACSLFKEGKLGPALFEVDAKDFDAIPGAPFSYWISPAVREKFKKFSPFGHGCRSAWVGLQTNDNFQWLRLWWESSDTTCRLFKLAPFVKGGSHSPFFNDIHLSVRWGENGRLLKEWKLEQLRQGKITANNSKCWNEQFYFRKGITWPLRAHTFAPQVMPEGCIFSVRGAVAFSEEGTELATLAVFNSSAFDYLYKTALGRFGFPEFGTGTLLKMPWPEGHYQSKSLAEHARKAWSAKRKESSVRETTREFVLPSMLRSRLGDYDVKFIDTILVTSKEEIDNIVFDLYGFSGDDRLAAHMFGFGSKARTEDGFNEASSDDDEDAGADVSDIDGVLSWAVGVSFGRFDWRLATGDREPPPEADPFDPLPPNSPGMLPADAAPFHANDGVMVDDLGHPHDLTQQIEKVLSRVGVEVPDDVRRWLQRDFFPMHLQQYSKSRRKAPIYWPIATPSGNYTLWLYYPSLNSQTLYTAINDFVEPKLKQIYREIATLSEQGASRSRDDERAFETLRSLEVELTEFRDTLLGIALTYRPNHDDGVQIAAAPLWPLFRHKQWQKVLNDTWAKLEKGEYDWAHLAMSYWPERVREKCKTDKSLAIAHALEHLYVEPEPQPVRTRGRKKDGGE